MKTYQKMKLALVSLGVLFLLMGTGFLVTSKYSYVQAADSAKSQVEEQKRAKEGVGTPYPGGVPALLELFKSENWKDRKFALRELALSKDMRALHPLIDALLNDERVYIRAQAASALLTIESYHKDTTAVPALVSALKDVFQVRCAAAGVLVMLGYKEEALPVLASIARGINKENWVIDYEGYGFCDMSDEEIKAEVERMKDINQRGALRRLGEIGTQEAIAVLEDIASHHKDVDVREDAIKVLEDLKKQKEAKKEGKK